MHKPDDNIVAGLSAGAVIAAIFLLTTAPLHGATFVMVLLAAVAALLVCIRALVRNSRGGGVNDRQAPGDGTPSCLASGMQDYSPPSSPDDGQRACSVDAPLGSAPGDSGSAGSDCSSSSSSSSSSSDGSLSN